MSDIYIDNPEVLAHRLHYWKQVNLENDYVNLEKAVSSMATPDHLVEARPAHAARWVLCKHDQKGVSEALFHTAAIWCWGSNPETGNFVLPGEQAVSRVAESRIQTEISNFCQLSYAFNTEQDKSLWDAQKTFEAHITANKMFNKLGKSRRPWQNSNNPQPNYVMNSNIFVRQSAVSEEKKANFPYTLHPSIAQAIKANPAYMANPDRPRIFELVKGRLTAIQRCNPPYLARGDLLWLSFSAEFVIGGGAWTTTFIPYEIVRVGSVSPNLIGGASTTSGSTFYTTPKQGLQEGLIVLPGDDFPMHPPTREAETSQQVTSDAADAASVDQGSSEAARSTSPVYFTPSPPSQHGNDEIAVVSANRNSLSSLGDADVCEGQGQVDMQVDLTAGPTEATSVVQPTQSPPGGPLNVPIEASAPSRSLSSTVHGHMSQTDAAVGTMGSDYHDPPNAVVLPSSSRLTMPLGEVALPGASSHLAKALLPTIQESVVAPRPLIASQSTPTIMQVAEEIVAEDELPEILAVEVTQGNNAQSTRAVMRVIENVTKHELSDSSTAESTQASAVEQLQTKNADVGEVVTAPSLRAPTTSAEETPPLHDAAHSSWVVVQAAQDIAAAPSLFAPCNSLEPSEAITPGTPEAAVAPPSPMKKGEKRQGEGEKTAVVAGTTRGSTRRRVKK